MNVANSVKLEIVKWLMLIVHNASFVKSKKLLSFLEFLLYALQS